MSASPIDLNQLQAWVGRQEVREALIHPFPACAMAALLERPALPAAGDPLPLPWHWLYFLDTPRRSAIGEDGHPARGGFLPPVPLPRRMWAAGQMSVLQPLRIGAAARKTSLVEAVGLKEGRSGPLVFVTVRHTFEQDGRACVTEEQQIVYREAPAGPAPLPAGESAPQAADWSARLTPDPALLFRFSALTYNGHRIHYDRDYAMRREFYPALVVHGPLIATLLLDLLQREQPGARIEAFRFRALRPAFVDAPLQLLGKWAGEDVELWTAGADGALGMQALATLAGGA